MPRGTASSSKIPLSQEFVHSSDEDDEFDAAMPEAPESASSHGASGKPENPKSALRSTAEKAGHETTPSVSAAESEGELEPETPGESEENLSTADGVGVNQEETRLANTRSKTELLSTTKISPETTSHSTPRIKADAIQVKPFRPPQGFTKYRNRSELADDIVDAFATVDGKQIFHIVAPSSLPLSTIEQIDFSTVKTGAPVVEYRGKAYGLSESKSSSKGEVLLFPFQSKDGNFTKVSTPIKWTYAFGQQSAEKDLRLLSYINGTWKTDESLPQSDKARSQSAHRLKYRYTPFGVPTTPPATDSDSGENRPVFKAPAHRTSPLGTSRRELSDVEPVKDIQEQNDMITDSPASRNSKKKRKTDSQEETLPIRTPSKQQNPPQSSIPQSEKKRKKKMKALE